MSTTLMLTPVALPTPEEPAKPRSRRVLVWVALGVAMLLIGGAGALVQALLRPPETALLDPQGVGSSGAQALVRVLEAEGVNVTVVRDRAAVEAALTGGATLVIADAAPLGDEILLNIVDAAERAVVLGVASRIPALLIPGSDVGTFNRGGAVAAACELPAARNAGQIMPGRVIELSSRAIANGAAGCYPVDDGFGLVTGFTADGTPTTLIDASQLFTNEFIAQEGNAALALGILGGPAGLVWYVPGLNDGGLTEVNTSLSDLTPNWVSPAILLLLCAGVAAGFWRGRRFGPLVAERLPVTVRASETTEGRARLYARSRDAVHAADQLRIGTLKRLARMLALGPRASAYEIADAAAGRVGVDAARVRGILLDDLPRSDAQLVALSDRLRELESAVSLATRPERNRP